MMQQYEQRTSPLRGLKRIDSTITGQCLHSLAFMSNRQGYRSLRNHAGYLGLKAFALLAIVAVLACCTFNRANAQTDLSSITGTVTDTSGAVVPGCQIELQTSATRSAVTDAKGFYSVPSLTLGNYSLTATAAGFGKTTSSVLLTLSGATANLRLKVGTTAQQVTVNGGGTAARADAS